MELENVDWGELLTVLGAIMSSVIAAGVVFSRFTKTDKDDKFFARLAGIFRPQK